MLHKIKKQYYMAGAAMTMGIMGSSPAHAQAGGTGFSEVSNNLLDSITDIPTLLSGIAYLLGALFAVLGILKIKDHVENAQQTPLKEGAIRLAAGGALLAFPFMTEVVLESVGETGGGVNPSQISTINFAP